MLVGGLVFGIYFGLGLGYFETFDFGANASIWVQLPVFGLMAVVCIGLGLLLFSGGKQPGSRGKARPAEGRALKLLALPLLGFGVAALLLGAYASAVTEMAFSMELLSRIAFHLLLVGLLPVVAVLVFLQGQAGNSDLEAEKNEEADAQREDRPVFALPTGPGGEGFEVPLDDLVMVEAADNYCKFHCVVEGQRKVKTFRISMKEVAQNLEQEARFHRCHRSFLVNAAMLEEIQGTSQAYKLKLRLVEEPVPVSRSFDIAPLRALLEGR